MCVEGLFVNLWDFEGIDWDPEDEDEDRSNLTHCLRHGVTEIVVDEVLRENPIEVKLKVVTAEFVVVGPDRGGKMWTLFFDTSFKRGDFLRPITGRAAKPEEVEEWKRAGGRK